MRVHFSPWQICSGSTFAIRRGVNSESTPTKRRKERKGHNNGSSSQQEFKEDSIPALSLCCKTISLKKKKKPQLFQPLLCVTQPHSIFLIGDNNNSSSYYDHKEYDNDVREVTNDLIVSNSYSWISKPGKFYGFLPEDNKKQRRVVPAVFSSSGDLVAAYQHNNMVVCIWDAKLNTGPSDDSNRLKLPKNLCGTSLQFVGDRWLIGSMNDGSLFHVDCCSSKSRELEVARASSEDDSATLLGSSSSSSYLLSQESFILCSTSPTLTEEQLMYVYLISEVRNENRQNVIALRTFSICLSEDRTEAATATPRIKLIRTVIVPFTGTRSPKEGTKTDFKNKTTMPQQDIQLVHSACTLKQGSTIAILAQNDDSNEKYFHLYILDVANGVMNILPTVSIPSYGVSIGCVSPYHIAVAFNHSLSVIDLRYDGSIIYETDALQIFGAITSKNASMKIVQSDSSSRALAIYLVDDNTDTTMLAYSTFCIPGQQVTMADALASSISITKSDMSTNHRDRTSATTCSIKLHCQLLMNRLASYCTDLIDSTSTAEKQQAASTSKKREALTWESLFEEALVEIQQALRDSKAVKLIENESREKSSMMNGGSNCTSIIRQHEDLKIPQNLTMTDSDANLHDFLLCAANGSIRILIHEHSRRTKISSPCNGNVRSTVISTSPTSLENHAAVKVFVKCCSLTKVSMRQINHIVRTDTKNSCKSFVQFLCQASLLKLLHFSLGNCTEVSESDLVLALSYILCVASFNDLLSFYCSMNDELHNNNTSATCNGISKAPRQDPGNKETVSDRILEFSNITSHDVLVPKLVRFSKQFQAHSSSNPHHLKDPVSSKEKAKMLLYSRLYWTRFIVCRCATNLNPSLLRSAFVHCLIKPLGVKGCSAQKHLELILLSMTALLQKAVDGRNSVLPSLTDGLPPGANKRIVEWVEALVDALQFCIVTENQKNVIYSLNDRTSNQVLHMLRDVTEKVLKLKAFQDIISCSMANILRGGKRRRSEDALDEVETSKRHDGASRTIPPYSIERIVF